MYFKQNLLAILIGSSLLLSGCGGNDSDNKKPVEPPKENPKPIEPTVQDKAALTSKNANIAIFGDIDKSNFSETSLKTGVGVLLLDDKNSNAAGFALDLKEKQKTLDDFSSKYLQEFTDALKNKNAIVNVLNNRVSTNTQGQVTNVTLEVDFSNAQDVTVIRDLLLAQLNGGSGVATARLAALGQTESKLRINLAFWISENTGFIWVNTYGAKNSELINKIYGDLNIASALSSNTPSKVKTVTEPFTQNAQGTNAVDILWSIDSSGSMYEEQKNLANGADQFFSALNNAGIDYRLAVNTHDAYDCKTLRTLSDNKTKFIDKNTPDAKKEWAMLSQPGTGDSGTETGFYCVREANLTGFDRPNAKNLVVFVSDEPENETMEGYIYTNDSQYVKRDFTDYKNYFLNTGDAYFAIVGTANFIRPTFKDSGNGWSTKDWQCSGEGGSAQGGGHFKEIARLTGGSSASICADASSWSVVFDEIIKAASGLASSFKLKHTPIPSSVKITVAGKNIVRDTTHKNGFDLVYSTSGTSIVFYGNALPSANQKVEVVYDYLQK